jgi:hypothetical protein
MAKWAFSSPALAFRWSSRRWAWWRQKPCRSRTRVGAGDLYGVYGHVAGITGPLAGLVMAWAGVPVIYLAAAGLVAMAF